MTLIVKLDYYFIMYMVCKQVNKIFIFTKLAQYEIIKFEFIS